MRKKLWLYLFAIAAVLAVLVLFNREYRSLTGYSELAARHNLVYSSYQNLSTQITNAAVLNPNLLKAIDSTKTRNFFFTDSTEIIRQLNMLRSAVRDTENIKIAANLDKTIRTELSWLLNSNLPDSIINHRSPAHIASFERIDSLIKQGILRTVFLIEERKKQLSDEADKLKLWITLFVILSGCLLMYVTFGLFSQRSQRKRKEQELESVFNRINDSVVSVDTCWRYTFLNDTALATHPLGKAETIGRSIWDVHPEMKGTIFWDKYHEAMIRKKVVEIEDYYAPMDTWFSVKVYPSADGLTIFYKDITQNKKAEQELLQSLREVSDYKFALDESSIVAITDHRGIINYVNDNFCKISKYSRDELVGQDHRIVNSGFHDKTFIKELWVTIANGKIWKGELKNKAKDGGTYWVDTTIVPFLNDLGKPYQYIAIRADITERKLSEENLQQSLKEIADYKYALDESSIVAITDQKGIIKYVNDNFCKISKYSRHELLGEDHRIIKSGFHDKAFIKELWVTIANGKIWKGELKNKAKDGSTYWVDTTIVPFLNDLGKPYQYVAIRADITERKKLEEEQALFVSIVNSSHDAILSKTLGGVITTWNHGAEEIFGYTADEIVGQNIALLIPTFYWSQEYEIMESIRQGKVIDHYETERIRKDGKIIAVSLTISPLRDASGNITGASKIVRDVSRQKRAEQEINQLNADLEKKVLERTNELLQAKNKLSETLEQISFLATIADNIQDPVISTDNDFIITSWNKPAEKLFEWRSDEVIGKTTVEVLQTSYPVETRQQILESFAEKDFWQGELIYHTKSGKRLNVLATLSHVKDANGHVTGNLALVRDITARKKAEIQLKEFEHFFNNSNDFSCIANTEGHFEIVNASFNKLLGYTQNELSRKPFLDFVHPDDIAATREAYEDLKAGAPVIHFFNRYRKKDGTYLLFDWNATPNVLTGKLYCIARDITERKKNEDALSALNAELEQKVTERTEAFRQSEEQYRYLFQNNPMPMWVINLADFKFLDVNEMATLRYGYSREEFLSMTAVDIRPPEDAVPFISSDHGFESDDLNYNKGIWRHRKKDGSIILVEIIAHKILFEGTPARLILAHDVTEQQQAEEKLVRNEKRFRALVENSNDIISLLSADLIHLYRSPSAERVTGFSLEERIKSGSMGEIHPEDYPAFERSLAEVKANPGKTVPLTYRLKHRNGHYIWLDGSYTNMIHDPAVGAIVANMRDITERKNIEQKIINLNEELEERVITRTEQLRRSNEELEAFSYSVSHDLRAPLRGIIGFANILEEDYASKLDDEAKRITAVIKNNTAKMGVLIDDLLSFSRLGRQPVTKIKISFNDTISEVIAELGIKKNNDHLSWVIPELPVVDADPNSIKQVWMNLVSNAVKYSNKNEHPVIEIGSIVEKDETIFFIKDNGVGFDTKYKDKLFKVFQRLHSVYEFEGTGVGLAIVEKIITRHGGRVWADAEPGKGACFYFSLPQESHQPIS